MAGDGIIQLAQNNKKFRTLNIELLISPADSKTLKWYADEVFQMMLTNNKVGAYGIFKGYTKDRWHSKQEEISDQDIKEAIMDWAAQLHRSFRAQDITNKTLIALQLVLPPSDVAYTNGQGQTRRLKEENSALSFVLNYTFPFKNRFVNETHDYIRAYTNGIHDEHRFARYHIIAAILIAAEQTAGQTARAGTSLGTICEMMGPAETKTGQAAESHPAMPNDIRQDMKHLKTHAAEPPRWEIFEWINQVVPPEERAKIKHYGEILGSGSFFVSMLIETDSGKEVLQVMRPYAKKRAEAGFQRLTAMTHGIAGDEEPRQVLREIIEEARGDAIVETNPKLFPMQCETFQNLYDGVTVTVRDSELQHQVRFAAPKLCAWGNEFRRAELMAGQHFNELNKDDQHTRIVAKAILTLELNNIMTGKAFDKDGHGGNCRVDGNKVSRFDSGGALLQPPEEEDLKLLGGMIHDAFLLGDQDRGFADSFLAELTKYRAIHGELPSLAKSVQKALLSLSDYQRVLDPQDLLEVFASSTQNIHPAAQEGFFTRLADSTSPESQATMGASKLLKLFSDPPCKIERTNPDCY